MSAIEKAKERRREVFEIIEGRITPPIVAIVGYSGSGKTTFLEKLISALTRRGFNVGTIKHDVHGFEMDKPGKDTWRHKRAGARTTLISSPYQIGMVRDVGHDHSLPELAPFLADMDLILAEGFKRSPVPKMEIFRTETNKDPACRNDENLLALISDADLDWGVPRYRLDDVEGVAAFLIRHFSMSPALAQLQQKAAS